MALSKTRRGALRHGHGDVASLAFGAARPHPFLLAIL